MSEDVTYATLTFQDSVGAGNNQDRNNLRKRGRSSEKARLDLGEWTGGQCFEFLALVLMLKIGVLWKLRNGDKVVEYISRTNVPNVEEKTHTFQNLFKLCDITMFHEALCYGEKIWLDMSDRD